MTRYTKHKEKWSKCKECELWVTREKVVLVRGKLPCDVLFVGEAPGISENVLGKPFIGPAGKLLDKIIASVVPDTIRWAITNLVACIPLGEDGNKISEPSKDSILSCAPRLTELYGMANPSLVVCVGKLASKYVNVDTRTVHITHPAAILRMDPPAKSLEIRRCQAILENEFGLP